MTVYKYNRQKEILY